MFIRFGAGASLPRHTHVGDELVYVLEGSVADDYGAVTAGNVGYRPRGCLHTVNSPRGATAFAVITGGTRPAGNGEEGGPPSEVFDLATMVWTIGRRADR
jgi:anti-sigma factor ChrR (cupin superfamily)